MLGPSGSPLMHLSVNITTSVPSQVKIERSIYKINMAHRPTALSLWF